MKRRQLSNAEKLAMLRLIRSENVGPATIEKLMAFYESPIDALEALPLMAQKGGARSKISICPKNKALAEIENLQKIGGFMLFSCENDYPLTLGKIKNPPPVLSVLGQKSLFQNKMVAFVGSRNASLNGKNLTRQMAFECVQNNINVVSGMALGIDGASHEGALACSNTYAGTIAVLGCGVDVIYPPEHLKMYSEIKERGAIVSEFAFSTAPTAMNFPRRNRIIAGLCEGTVVIEAKEKSGSLITAQFTKEQQHILMAVPGSPLDDRSIEPNRLIKNGAIMVQSARDILGAISAQVDMSLREQPANDVSFFHLPDEDDIDNARPCVLRALSTQPVSEEELSCELSLPNAIVSVILLELELAGRLERHSMGRVSLIGGIEEDSTEAELFEE